ncbi:cadherin repeat domain-containing protein, partial [Gammaproteobacteria bacterium]|nr:cadherin repeat domain-containing protein [Gammaproteobacteria bacterium]
VLKTLEVSTYTENGSIYIKVTGNVTDTNFSSLNLTFSLAGNPEANTISLGIYPSNISYATYGNTYDATTGDFTAYRVLTDTNPGGTYYLERYSTYDEAGNNVYQGITGSTDTPLFGGSVVIDNPNAIIDNTAPVVNNLEVSTYTENGSIYIKVTGNVTDTNFSSLNLTFSLAGNPEANTISLGIYPSNISYATYGNTYDATTGDFTAYRVLTDTNPGGTYYLERYSTYDEAGNNVYQGITGSTDTPLFGGSVVIAKDAPTSISIAASDLDEGQLGTSLGKIQVNAKDGYGLFTLSITGADAGLLEISSLGYLRLKSSVSLDFDDQQTLNFQITATNTLGESFDRSYSLSIQDLQLAPTAVLLDGVNKTTVQVEENQTGALVGNLSSADGDDADTHTYALSEDSEIFEISNNTLKFKDGVSLNFEDQNSYTVTVTSTDSTGLSYSEIFTIQVTDINEAPTDITLASLNIPERLDGAEIGLITVSDVDANESFTISVNDDRFEVVNNVLKLKDSVQLQFSQVSQVTLIVTVTDSGGNSLQESFTLLVGSIQLDVYAVDENVAGASVGALSVSDTSVTGDISYVLSGSDADQFEVVDGVLKLKSTASADFETKSSYTLTITATGANNVAVEASLIVNVSDLNDAPTAVTISGDLSINENQAGASIGTLGTTDEDAGDSFVYSVSGTDADSFEIVNGILKLKAGLSANYEIQSSYSVTITSTDSGGLQISNNFEVQVSDLAESPTAIIVSKDAPAPPPTGEGETIQIVVTVQNNQFYFNGELQSEFKLVHGNTYVFQQNAGENGHVLGISAVDGGASVAGITYSYQTSPTGAISNTLFSTYDLYLTNPAYASALSNWNFFLTYTVPADGPDTLYFFSSSSAVTGGVFNVGSAYVAPPPSPTPVDPDAIVINENELG